MYYRHTAPVVLAAWFQNAHHAQTTINVWLRQYNHIRPHYGLDMRPPVPEALIAKTKISARHDYDRN
jgi:putative transposase